MKRRRKTRTVTKWTGVAVIVLLLIALIGSGWLAVDWQYSPTSIISVYAGQMRVSHLDSKPQSQWVPGWYVDRWSTIDRSIQISMPEFNKRFENQPLVDHPILSWLLLERSSVGSFGITETSIGIPIWSFIVVTGIPTLLMFRTDRKRARIGLCPNCGYSRSGLAADRACPECGTPTPSA